jgi:hypothetical protein
MSGFPPIVTVKGWASAKTGQRLLDWKLETTDGQCVKCWVNGKEYDLSNDGILLVKTKGGKTEVEQLPSCPIATDPKKSFAMPILRLCKARRIARDRGCEVDIKS